MSAPTHIALSELADAIVDLPSRHDRNRMIASIRRLSGDAIADRLRILAVEAYQRIHVPWSDAALAAQKAAHLGEVAAMTRLAGDGRAAP